MATLLQLRTMTAEAQNDQGFGRFTSAQYDDAISRAERELAGRLKILHKRDTISSVNGTQSYDLPSDFMAFFPDEIAYRSIIYTDSLSALTYPYLATYDYMSANFDDLLTATGTPDYFWKDGDTIKFYKIPDYDGTDNISIDYYYYPATKTLDADILDTPDRYKYALKYLAAAYISELSEIETDVKKFRDRSEKELLLVVNSSNDYTIDRNDYCGR